MLCCVSFKTQSNGRAGHRWGYLWRYRAVSIWRSHRSLLSALLLAAIKCSRVPSNLLDALSILALYLSLSHTQPRHALNLHTVPLRYPACLDVFLAKTNFFVCVSCFLWLTGFASPFPFDIPPSNRHPLGPADAFVVDGLLLLYRATIPPHSWARIGTGKKTRRPGSF